MVSHVMVGSSTVSSLVDDAQAIFRAAVQRVQADRLLSRDGNWPSRSLTAYDNVHVVGMGKAAMAMAGVVEAIEPGRVDAGTVVVPEGYPNRYPDRLPIPETIDVVEGGHPLPTRASVQGGRRLLEHATAATTSDLVLVLVSGGGTALSTVPVDALDLVDLRTTYQLLLMGGVPIEGANAVRKHLTTVGGGQLARVAAPAEVSGIVVSDVVGDDLSTVASGPTVPDPTTFEDAVRVLYRYDLWHDVPASIREHLVEGASGREPETPDADDPCFQRTHTHLLGSNEDALEAARAEAKQRGYVVGSVTSGVEGEARVVGRDHVEDMLERPVEEPTCWLWGGETTVTVRGDGTGGRNQEVALGGALEMAGRADSMVLLSGGTDGIDGPTDAAGAWATPETADAARAAGCDPEEYLRANNAYPLFDAIRQLLKPGPTHTNVMDVQIGLVDA